MKRKNLANEIKQLSYFLVLLLGIGCSKELPTPVSAHPTQGNAESYGGDVREAVCQYQDSSIDLIATLIVEKTPTGRAARITMVRASILELTEIPPFAVVRSTQGDDVHYASDVPPELKATLHADGTGEFSFLIEDQRFDFVSPVVCRLF